MLAMGGTEVENNCLVIKDFTSGSVDKMIKFIYSGEIKEKDAAELELLLLVRKLALY
jgi:hypothetical protein